MKLTQKGKKYIEEQKAKSQEMVALCKKFREIIPNLPTNKKELTKAVYDAAAGEAEMTDNEQVMVREKVLDELAECYEQLGNLYYLKGDRTRSEIFYGVMVLVKQQKFDPTIIKKETEEAKLQITKIRSKIEAGGRLQ